MKKFFQNSKFNTAYLALALLGILFFQNLIMQSSINSIPYSEFKKLLKSGELEQVIISQDSIKGTLKNFSNYEKKFFITNRVESDLADELDAAGVKYSQAVDSNFIQETISWLLPMILFILIWFFFLKKLTGKGGMGGGFMSIGKSKAKVYVEKDTQVTFNDVAGVDEAKQELQEIVDFLKNSQKYTRLGGRMPKGVLLVGPPGTGKTLIAKAVAGEAKVPFFSISGSEFVEMFVGVGAARVRDLFEQARKSSPCIIFVDELDALGKARGMSPMSGGHDEKEQTLNQLLTELDGFDSKEGIILLGATNRPEVLDQALLRAGRFDRQVLVDRPDKSGRIEILKVHSKKIVHEEKLDFEQIANLTTGFTGADLANLVNEAALVATRKDSLEVTLSDFNEALERLVAGLEKKSRVINPFERTVIAFHEMGHAIVAYALKSTDVVHKVSIIPRGIGALGYTMQRPTEDRFIICKEDLEKKIATLMGGRAAESIKFKHLSTGASDDIAKATDIAKNMITRYGMTEDLGPVAYQKDQNTFLNTPMQDVRSFSEHIAKSIDLGVKELANAGFLKATEILNNNFLVLEESANVLLEKETLDETELKVIFAKIVLAKTA